VQAYEQESALVRRNTRPPFHVLSPERGGGHSAAVAFDEARVEAWLN
jgi:hypothetical protein